MKKVYSSPVSEQVNLVTENMIAASMSVHPGTGAEQWTNGKNEGWSCDDWSSAAEEDEL